MGRPVEREVPDELRRASQEQKPGGGWHPWRRPWTHHWHRFRERSRCAEPEAAEVAPTVAEGPSEKDARSDSQGRLRHLPL